MDLGLKRDEVRLAEHQTNWKGEFERTKATILQKTDLQKEQIEHIGSTSIDRIKAKPIIDIVIGIESLQGDFPILEAQLRSCGFYRLKVERPDEIVFAQFADATFDVKTHFIHLVEMNGTLWKNLLFFRDFLNQHKLPRQEYEQIKENYVQDYSTGIQEYTDTKEAFVRSILQKRPHQKG